MSRTTTIVVALALIGAVIGIAGYAWSSMSDVAMSTNGWVALILGTILTVGVACALMILVFFSNRNGFDEAVATRQHVRSHHRDV